ncbi:MAG: hypothetical protein QOI42_1709 [Frankiaceae bacterium]|nr:hypothetical protein [Frankiaceae bacterium]
MLVGAFGTLAVFAAGQQKARRRSAGPYARKMDQLQPAGRLMPLSAPVVYFQYFGVLARIGP